MEDNDNKKDDAVTASAEVLVEVGVVTRAHGVKGQVKLRLHNPRSTLFSCPGPHRVCLAASAAPPRWLELERTAATREALVVRLAGVADRAAAEALRGARVLVDRARLEPPGEGEYYYTDLIGCAVVDEAGEAVGQVHSVFEAGASDVLVIRAGELERYIPLMDDWVTDVDLDRRRIQVRGIDQWDSWPAGR